MADLVDRMIRNLDRDLHSRARAEALKRGITIGDLVNEALALKLAMPPHESYTKLTPENGVEVRIVRRDGSVLLANKDGYVLKPPPKRGKKQPKAKP
ncbi:hypothetical protein ES703_49768 [subsurface metagenome]